MPQSHPTRLLTTPLSIAVALGITALGLTQSIRAVLSHHVLSVWLLGQTSLHGWLLIAVNVLLYLYVCWIAFWWIRGTAGRERLFIIGWFVGFLLWPLKVFWPRSCVAIDHIGALGLAMAVFAALALLLDHPNSVNGTTSTT
jgi:hypothetical protein